MSIFSHHPQLSVQTALHKDISHAPKLLALRQLLLQCGIGLKDESGEEDSLSDESMMPTSHRVLVFAQFKKLLDLVEADVMQPMGASYLRLDGRWVFCSEAFTASINSIHFRLLV